MNVRRQLLPALTAIVGLAVIVRTASAGKASGVLLGVLLLLAGALRLYVEWRRPSS